MNFILECERESDGRWLAEVLELPGVLAYGNSQNQAMGKAEVLALRALAEQLEHGEFQPMAINISLPATASAGGRRAERVCNQVTSSSFESLLRGGTCRPVSPRPGSSAPGPLPPDTSATSST